MIVGIQVLTFCSPTDNMISKVDYQQFKIMEEIGQKEYQCPSDAFLNIIKGKCKTTLIILIKKGRNRFGEIHRTLPTISERMLSRQLDELESDGIINRTSYPELPPRVEYTLTEYGETLYPIVRQMRIWGYEYLERTSRE